MKFIAETEVWDSKITWATLASKYEDLLKNKKDVNRLIQTEEWAYRKAKEDRERERNESKV